MSTNVFQKSATLDVSFDNLRQDLVRRARERLLSQFKSNYPLPSQFNNFRDSRIRQYTVEGYSAEEANRRANQDVLKQRDIIIETVQSPVLAQVMNAIGEEFNELYQAGLQVLEKRTLAKAEGVSLDVLGDIVGVSRTLFDYSLLPWLEPDSVQGFNPDSAKAWVDKAPLVANQTMKDQEFRSAILAKIFKNHCSSASVPEICSFLTILLGKKASIIKTDKQELALVIPAGTATGVIRYLTSELNAKSISSNYIVPLPPTVDIRDDIFYIVAVDDQGNGCSFCPDQSPGRPDYAKSIVNVDITRRSYNG